MKFVLKEGATKDQIKEIEDILYKKKSSSGFNARKYNGLMSFKDDPLSMQKKLRNEWEREIS